MAAMKMILDSETTSRVIGKKLEPAKEEIYRPTYSLRVDRAKYTMRYNDLPVHHHTVNQMVDGLQRRTAVRLTPFLPEEGWHRIGDGVVVARPAVLTISRSTGLACEAGAFCFQSTFDQYKISH